MPKTLAKEYRGNILENIHIGHICGIDCRGKIVYKVGNPYNMTYMRSCAKPIQALPVLKRQLHRKFGLTEKETTILAASHKGENFHIRAIESILYKIGANESDLTMLPTYPGHRKTRRALLKADKPPRRIYHNCSGKHSGILALCKGLNISSEGYWNIDHPVQREILNYISLMSGCQKEDISIGIDGCGVPVFAMPLYRIAKSYLKLACPNLIEDKLIGEAADQMISLMNKQREMISGTNTLCTTLLGDSNIVAKGGAQGVYCISFKNERLAFAIKIMGGTHACIPIIIAAILDQIGYANKKTIDNLYNQYPTNIVNDNDEIVGERHTAFVI